MIEHRERGGPSVSELDATKAVLVEAVKVLDQMGVWEANFGHVSARLPDPRTMCMLGHLHGDDKGGRPLSKVGAEDMIVVNIDTLEYEGELNPPGEVHIHAEVYKAREEIGGVVHAHPEMPVALSIAGQAVLPVHYYSNFFHPAVPIFPDHRIITTSDLGEGMVRAMGDQLAVVLSHHGATTAGRTIEEAVIVMSALDTCARLQYAAAQLGEPRSIPVERSVDRHLPVEYIQNKWSYFSNMVKRG
ncbi:MAG: hypothetical protein GEU71_12785 [Actinobacteria bacterium]|nr:hypothetical protein [Actinomycetota bacterium]